MLQLLPTDNHRCSKVLDNASWAVIAWLYNYEHMLYNIAPIAYCLDTIITVVHLSLFRFGSLMHSHIWVGVLQMSLMVPCHQLPLILLTTCVWLSCNYG